MDQNTKNYRPCVGVMLINKYGYVFTGQRFDSNEANTWQMPQGGIEDGEEPKQAALRELQEEVGINTVEIIAEDDDWIYYDLPLNIIPNFWGGRYCGQKQKWFLMKFLGEDKNININSTNPEFKAWRWQEINNLPNDTISFKKDVYRKVVKKFSSV